MLAAGGSRRLGRPKQLLRYRGRPLLLHATDTARAVASRRVVVVLGAHSARLRVLLARERADVVTARNPRWRTGLAGSLRAGLAALPARARAALILLGDQPQVSVAALGRLVAAWRAQPLRPAAAVYRGRAGVPAILPRACWPAARRLRGDVGARGLLREAPTVTTVDMPEAAMDIDTPPDVAKLSGGRRLYRRRRAPGHRRR